MRILAGITLLTLLVGCGAAVYPIFAPDGKMVYQIKCWASQEATDKLEECKAAATQCCSNGYDVIASTTNGDGGRHMLLVRCR